MKYLILALCLLAAACAGGTPGAPTSPSSASGGPALTEAKGGSELPFKGTFEATETGQPQGDTLLVNLVGSGNATQLGRFTLTAQFTVVLTLASSGTATWTAANGDRVFTTVTGQGVISGGTATSVETYTITGGTGRFTDASGSIVVERLLDLQTLVSSASMSGLINLGR